MPAIAGSPAGGSHKSGWPMLIVGILFTLVCIGLTMVQIQTNESAFLHEPLGLLHPRWQTIIQPYDFIVGNLDNEMSKAVVFAWVSELLFIGCIIGFEEAHHAVKLAWRKIAWLFLVLAFILIGWNVYTDYLYGGSGFWSQVAFSISMFVAVVFFGIIGPFFIEMGIGRVKGP